MSNDANIARVIALAKARHARSKTEHDRQCHAAGAYYLNLLADLERGGSRVPAIEREIEAAQIVPDHG